MKSVRNRFEARFQSLHPELEYETIKLPYVQSHNYIPDFIDHETKTIFETKGRLTAADKSKMKAVRDQHPDWRFVFVLQTPNRKVSKNSTTTYSQWCERNGFEWQSI